MENLPKHKKLIVYGRRKCHLCEEMIVSLRALQEGTLFEFEVIDIDGNENLTRLYGEHVPVLYAAAEKRELCHYFLDPEVVNAYLS